MKTYQELILDTLETDATNYDSSVVVSKQMRFGNQGRLIAHDGGSLGTLAYLDFDFQSSRVRMSLNENVQVGQPTIGPRSGTLFWWIPGNADDDNELVRMRGAWVSAIAEAGK